LRDKFEGAGNKEIGEGIDPGIQVADRAIIETAGILDVVLDFG